VALAVGVLATVVAERAAVALPPVAVSGVVRAVSVDGLSRAVARGLVSPRVAATTEGVLRSMFATRLRTAAATILCCGLVLAGALGAWRFAGAQPSKPDPLRSENNSKLEQPLEKALAEAPVDTKVVTVFPLKKLDPEATAKVIADAYKEKGVTVAALKNDRALMFYADEKQTVEILALLRKRGESAPKKASVFHLHKLVDPTRAAKSIHETITAPRSADIVVVPVPEENALLVYASDEDTKEIRRLLRPTVLRDPVLRAIQLKHLKAEDVVPEVRTLLSPEGRLVVLSNQNQIVVQDRPEILDRIEKRIRALEEEAQVPRSDPKEPIPPKKFSVRFKNTKWADVLDWYAMASGLSLVTTVKPTGTFTFDPPEGKQFTLAEITDILNEGLARQKYILIRRTTSFFLHPADEKLDSTSVPRVEAKNLFTRGQTEIVELRIPLTTLDAAEIKGELARLLTPFGSIVFARGRELIICDTVGNLDRILKTLEAIDMPAPKPPAPAAAPKKDPVKFQQAPWKDVFAWYAKESGLKLVGTELPGGTFTLVPPNTRAIPADPLGGEGTEKPVPRRELTLDEVADRINEALLPQKWLLVPRPEAGAFHVITADRNLDPKLVKDISRAELAAEGHYTLVEVTIDFTRPDAPELVQILRKNLTPFGQLVSRQMNRIVVRDIAGNLRDLATPRPEKPPPDSKLPPRDDP
jgi:hypothetical protein